MYRMYKGRIELVPSSVSAPGATVHKRHEGIKVDEREKSLEHAMKDKPLMTGTGEVVNAESSEGMKREVKTEDGKNNETHS
ncbi:hypothetical protein GLAREA_05142 [Glarea lozoyensis ATCC 20868]|uniref:Uncharacterized protein n=1 Tax=Glarea lozoyensis (strain ATCC 20868 / MF5171) TaxID=1116229 RepID=S3DFD8_GLAL2|nr:uncharacterized protein GLAREA_05142 [Glarea lozoyensis ATCC 20868]EPE35804.1 hypothetical protein GLAREA_05142 [Glarea lozoyensis ATCC 20868]